MADYIWCEGGKIISVETGEDRTQCDQYPLFEPGDRITFGVWGGEPIMWRVLEDEWCTVLLITEKIIDCSPYNDKRESITWENCGLRKWLNGPFLHGAFDDAERGYIMLSHKRHHGNARYGTRGGSDTWDRVFCLSIDEALKHFKDDEDRRAAPTAKAVSEGAVVFYGHSSWWLRSPGGRQDLAACVISVGNIGEYGCSADLCTIGARPVIDLEYWV